MKQPQLLVDVVTQHQQTNSLSLTPSTSLTRQEQKKQLAIVERFGDRDAFLNTVTPKTQAAFAAKPMQAFMGDYPTITGIRIAYGGKFPEQWLYPQIADLALFTGAANINKEQMRSLASVIATEYHYLKVTEILIFFHRFKAGHYGRFYGSVDPMVITCALREFIKDRNLFIEQYERELQNAKREQEQMKLQPTVTREEYEAMKSKKQ